MAEDQTHFLQQAEKAEVNAAKATDPNVKRRFLEIAKQWRRLANPVVGRWRRPTKDDDAT
jgi:hypothetical protein